MLTLLGYLLRDEQLALSGLISNREVRMTATIRLAVPEHDAMSMLDIYAPIVRETAISFELEPPSEAVFRQRMSETLTERPWLACVVHDGIVGYAYASSHRERTAYSWSAESSVYVSTNHRKEGIAKALYTSLFAILKVQGYYNVYAGTALPNAASVALHRACGFERVGTYRQVGYKLGAWHDVAWWQLSLQEKREGKPEPPRPIGEVIGTVAFEEALRQGVAQLDNRGGGKR